MQRARKLLSISSTLFLLVSLLSNAYIQAESIKTAENKSPIEESKSKTTTPEAPWLRQSPFAHALDTRNPFNGPGEPLTTTLTMLKLILIDEGYSTYWGIRDGATEENPNTLWYFDGYSWCPVTATVPATEEEVPTESLVPLCLIRCPDGTLFAIHSDKKVYVAAPEDILIDTEEECNVSITFAAVVPGADDPDFDNVLKSTTSNKLFGIAPDLKLWHHTPSGWVFTNRILAHIKNYSGCDFLIKDNGNTTVKLDPDCEGDAPVMMEV